MAISRLLNRRISVWAITLITIFQACSVNRRVESEQVSNASVTQKDASVAHNASSTPVSFDARVESIDDASSQNDARVESIDDSSSQNRLDRDVAMGSSSFQKSDATALQKSDASATDLALIDSAIEPAEPPIPIPVFTCDGDELSADAITTLFQPGTEDCRGDVPEEGCAGQLLVKDSYIYFVRDWNVPSSTSRALGTSTAGWLYRMEAKCGAMVEDLGLGWIPPQVTTFLPGTPYSADLAPNYNHLVSGGDFVYMVSDQLYRLDTRDLSHQTMNIAAGCTSDIAANDDEIFVYDSCNQRILRAAHGQRWLRLFSEVDGEDLIGNDYEGLYLLQERGFIAVGTDSLYYSQGNIVWKHALDSTDPTASIPLFTAQQDVLALACDDQAVIVVHDLIPCTQGYSCEVASVTRVPLDGGEPEDIGTTVPSTYQTAGSKFSSYHQHFFAWMTPIKDGQVYIRELDDNNVVQVVRIGTDGTGRTPVLRRSNSFLAVDRERLYWTENGGLFTSLPQSPIPAGPSSSIEPKWVSTNAYSDSLIEENIISALTPDNGIVLISNDSDIDGIKINLVKLSAAGVHEWTTLVSNEFEDYPNCLVLDGAGRITVVTSKGTYPNNVTTFHVFEADGTRIGTTPQEHNTAHYYGCQGDKEGNIYIFNDPHFEKWSAARTLIWSSDITPYPNIQGFKFGLMALAEPGVVAVGHFPKSNPNEEPEINDPGLFAVLRISDEGRIQWTKRFIMSKESRLTNVATAPDGRILVSGYTADFVSTGSHWVSVPRPFELFTFMLWFAADGSIESISLLDCTAGSVTVDPNGDVYLFAGDPWYFPQRPFYFEPPYTEGNYIPDLALAKVDANGTLIGSTELTPFIDDSLPSGSLGFPVRILAGKEGVVVIGNVYRNDGYEENSLVMMFDL